MATLKVYCKPWLSDCAQRRCPGVNVSSEWSGPAWLLLRAGTEPGWFQCAAKREDTVVTGQLPASGVPEAEWKMDVSRLPSPLPASRGITFILCKSNNTFSLQKQTLAWLQVSYKHRERMRTNAGLHIHTLACAHTCMHTHICACICTRAYTSFPDSLPIHSSPESGTNIQQHTRAQETWAWSQHISINFHSS